LVPFRQRKSRLAGDRRQPGRRFGARRLFDVVGRNDCHYGRSDRFRPGRR
jgi:hypothetical protein